MKTDDRRDIVALYRDGWSESCGCWDRIDGQSRVFRTLFGWGLLRMVWSLFRRVAGRRMAWDNGPRAPWGRKRSGRVRRRVSAIYGRTA